jgi:hypothetical protein
MRAAFGGIAQRDEGEMTVAPHPSYGDIAHFYKARVLQLDIGEQQQHGPTRVPSPWIRPFVLSLRQADPRYFVTEAFEDDFTMTTEYTVENLGLADAEPKFTLTQEIAGMSWTLERRNPGTPVRELTISNITLTAGQSLVVYFGEPWGRRRIVIEEAGEDEVDVTRWIEFVSSDWWNERVSGLLPGENVIYSSRPFDLSFYHSNW